MNGIDFSGLTSAVTSGAASIGPAVLTVAGVLIAVKLTQVAIRYVRGAVR
ncbi:hypothetical protein [Ralstonia sp. RRA.1]